VPNQHNQAERSNGQRKKLGSPFAPK